MSKINGIDKKVYEYVNEQLDLIEREFNVKVLYAVESGSRGWGFANEDSDYDIRFIYLRPLKDYLSITKKRDVIDINDLGKRQYGYDLDFQGWDITKALSLHRKSNPNLREHLIHTMVYRGDTHIFDGLPDFDLVTLKHAYGAMTYSNWKKYVKGEEMTPKVTKRYCYCIRQILAWILIDEYDDINAPVNIDDLFEIFKKDGYFGDELLNDMKILVEYYKSNCKLNKLSEKSIMRLSKFISKYLKIIKTKQDESGELPDVSIYDERFREILKEYNPSLKF